ncbi:MAG: LLM class flavin-dependent oxidoreductase, partial [Actinomycetota bacterium]
AVLLAAFAAVTERIELGTGVVLAPFHDPIRMAEDFAVLDQISGGRTLPGFGIAWREEEFRAFNIDTKTRVGRMVELIEILRLAWSEGRFDYSGRYFNYEQVAVTPTPFRPPPIYVGGFADEAVRRAGRIGDGYMSSRVPPDRAAQLFELATQGWTEAGKKGSPKIAILQNAFVTDDPERDWPMVRDGVGHQLGTYAGWLDTDVPGVEMKVKPPPEEKLRELTAFGTPDQVIEYLGPLLQALSRYPDTHLVLRQHYPGMDAAPAARSIELLGREVAPRLREAAGQGAHV